MTERVWTQPHVCIHSNDAAAPPAASSQLHLYNSLVDRKVPFIPIDGPDSKSISWYTCGPTVYDSTHMGHARNYLAFDVVRRVLEDYFGYSILYVMNITDVEDKIILRARRNYLLKGYLEQHGKDPARVMSDARTALATAEAKQREKCIAAAADFAQAEADVTAGGPNASEAAKRREGLADAAASEDLLLSKATASVKQLDSLGSTSPTTEAILSLASDALAIQLDAELKHTVTDPSIFRGHAARYEEAFLEDMATLGKKIVANGMAYVSPEGSVYFDTQSFRSQGHTYGKLNPWAVGSALAAEGEPGGEKRHPSDFALWKAAKPGEPTWPSPWGSGRPGWHIECSAMASAVIGQQVDIHTGGEDLRFPHHDNELAQAEAHYHCEGCQQWVNYFLHSGHLGIEGLKMSKSLKNFVTIREALETFSPRQLRLMMVLTPWDRRMSYGEQIREEMKARESQLRNFFGNVNVAIRKSGGSGGLSAPGPQKWYQEEQTLFTALTVAEKTVRARLMDSIDTRGAMDALSELIKAVNLYLLTRQDAAGPQPQAFLLKQSASFITKILSVFGDGIRAAARAGAAQGEFLTICDDVRDNAMINLGIRLEDQADGGSVWKTEDPAVLRAERDEKLTAVAAAAAKKIRSKLDATRRDLEKFEKLAALPSPQEALKEKYLKFSEETGEPTHDAEGAVLEGKALDKAKKEIEKQKKVRAPLEKRLAEDGPGFLDALKADVAGLEAKLAGLEV
ncbi:hypothetical protein Ndes2437A_g07295 [Nannochloris sp. 'desiccata']